LGKGDKGKTDWKKVDALTDEDIARAIANDPGLLLDSRVLCSHGRLKRAKP
jgi:arsenate reductase-like glutaredoxin family protein